MTMSEQNTNPKHRFIEMMEDEAKKAFALSIYFGTWFCALSFLAATILDERPIPLSIFGFAIVKGALSAKFLLISEAAFPMKVNKAKGLIRSLLFQSLIYVGIVLGLNYLEAGVEGLFHGKNFWDSLMGFGQKNPLRVIAMCIVYWLIVWPYLVLIGLKITLGSNATIAILFGDRTKTEAPASES